MSKKRTIKLTISAVKRNSDGTSSESGKILIGMSAATNLEDMKVIWDFEQLINSKSDTRIHITLE